MANVVGILTFIFACLLSIHISCSRICFSCTNLRENEICHHAIPCPENEVCFVQKYRSALHETRYDVGCTYLELCKKPPGIAVGKRSGHNHVVCQTCCDRDVCNFNKTCNDVHQVGSNTETCSSCSEIQNPASCNTSTVCEKDEICFLHKYVTESGQQQYDLGCKPQSMCLHYSSSSSSLVGRRFSTGRHLVCESCCSGQSLCNRDLQCSHTHAITAPRECADIPDDKDGVYTIFPTGTGKGVSVFCIMRSQEKWTVIQRRNNGSQSFDGGWLDYKIGFGSAFGEYWLGNDNIHDITTDGHHMISFYLEESSTKFGYANYSTFYVGDEQSKYILTINGYSGNTSDEMTWLNGMKFTTDDIDNDRHTLGNCASDHEGGWWYNACYSGNVNRMYMYDLWWEGFSINLTKSIMMIRRSM